MAIYKPRFYTAEKMRKVDDYYPIGEAVPGWYFYEEVDGAPIGPFASRNETMVGIGVQVALYPSKTGK